MRTASVADPSDHTQAILPGQSSDIDPLAASLPRVQSSPLRETIILEDTAADSSSSATKSRTSDPSFVTPVISDSAPAGVPAVSLHPPPASSVDSTHADASTVSSTQLPAPVSTTTSNPAPPLAPAPAPVLAPAPDLVLAGDPPPAGSLPSSGQQGFTYQQPYVNQAYRYPPPSWGQFPSFVILVKSEIYFTRVIFSDKISEGARFFEIQIQTSSS